MTLFLDQMSERGLVIVYTGDGKGKSTAAFGMALRAAGYGWRIAILQFIKGNFRTGEEKAFQRFSDLVEFRKLGIGFVTWHPKRPYTEHKEAAVKAFEQAQEYIVSDRYHMIILDEINNATRFGLIPVSDVISLIREKPKRLNLILTGRGADPKVCDVADLVTDMRPLKHPFDKGEWAHAGIDY